jgi:uncharacterized protein
MSSSDALATIRKLFQAVTLRDAAGCLAAYHPDGVISEAPSLPYGGDYSGPKGVMQHAEAFGCTWDRYQPEVCRDLEPEFVADGDRVVALWRFRAQGQGRDSLDLPAVGVYRLRDAKILESRMFYFDTVQLDRFLAGQRPWW